MSTVATHCGYVDSTFLVTQQVVAVDMTDGSIGYMATDPTRPGCTGYGATVEDATESLERARTAYDGCRTGKD